VVAGLLVIGAAHPATATSHLFALAPLMWIGARSYGIYLWHLFVMRWLEETWQLKDFWPLLGATVVLTIPIAAASWYLVEAPLLRRKDPRPRSRARDESPVPAEKTSS
jgi:peptidoglycan/LPS O-acetylase OafA/YrhL